MKLIRYRLGLVLLSTILSSLLHVSCNKDEPENTPEEAVIDPISAWLYDEMKSVYYWNYTFHNNIDLAEKTDPEAFFYELVYEAKDKWSFIIDDYEALALEFSGTPVSLGYSPSFYRFQNSDQVFIVVEYVYPGSPADIKGLKRGDIILAINSVFLNIYNYYDLYSETTCTVRLGQYSGNSIYDSNTMITMTVASFEADPLIYYTLFETSEKTIGYMVYTGFYSGAQEEFLESLNVAFDYFRQNNIQDLIVDLRYNPGGEITASTFLASAIAPANVAGNAEVFTRLVYNEALQSYFEEVEGPDSEHLVFKFAPTPHNIDLDRVYFLTTGGTASASELLMIGLEPYMDVVMIGETTHGKYTGSWLIYDFNVPRQHNWAMMPIVTKYANAEGFTDFENGLTPDHVLYDNLIGAKPFGDITDPMVAYALQEISGTSLKSSELIEKHDYELLDNKANELKRTLIIPR